MQASNNTILITGGASGIGFALAQEFIRHGNQVISLDRNPTKQAAAKTKLPALITLPCDLTKRAEIENILQIVQRDYPRLNVLINNAGIQLNYDLPNTPEAENYIYTEVGTNLLAPMLLSTLLLPQLRRQSQAAIVNISSALAFVPKADAPVYCATKAAVHSFSQTMRHQLGETSVRVFEIIPPLVATAMTDGRGSGKMHPETLAGRVMKAWKQDQFEVFIGKAALLWRLHRFFPGLANRIMLKRA